MNSEDVILGIVIALMFSLLYSYLDMKYKWFRVGFLYRERFWQNFLVNFVVVGLVYFAASYFLK